ncbi:MAG: hypothetical protein JAY90_20060 [Candidatus Thiodiazotropha lotti]|nr:hypothetical protein [Candidatus Thiodiazotropha lotti]
MKKTTRSSNKRPHVIEIKTTPAAEVRLKIQQEVARLQNISGLNAPMSAKDTLFDYADVLELNAVYLAGLENPALQPVIDSNIEMAAKIRYWLS